MPDQKAHWETVFTDKQANELSWTQEIPQTSLNFIDSFNLPKTAGVIDIGGGDSNLADFLLERGYQDITVLDISEKALERAKLRLGAKAQRINWVVSDITEYQAGRQFDIWHDRATFHFLTTEGEIMKYLATAERSVARFMTIGTFSEDGPTRCSGLGIKQYSAEKLQETLAEGFEKIRCITEDHITPFQTRQNFLYCSFFAKKPLTN